MDWLSCFKHMAGEATYYFTIWKLPGRHVVCFTITRMLKSPSQTQMNHPPVSSCLNPLPLSLFRWISTQGLPVNLASRTIGLFQSSKVISHHQLPLGCSCSLTSKSLPWSWTTPPPVLDCSDHPNTLPRNDRNFIEIKLELWTTVVKSRNRIMSLQQSAGYALKSSFPSSWTCS